MGFGLELVRALLPLGTRHTVTTNIISSSFVALKLAMVDRFKPNSEHLFVALILAVIANNWLASDHCHSAVNVSA